MSASATDSGMAVSQLSSMIALHLVGVPSAIRSMSLCNIRHLSELAVNSCLVTHFFVRSKSWSWFQSCSKLEEVKSAINLNNDESVQLIK